MRIIGGTCKGRLIESPKTTLRPTQGMLREAVFNICQFQVVGAAFLDLFAGSGAMGLEALSRGASRATFVDSDPAACRTILKNLNLLHFHTQGEVLKENALAALQRLEKEKRQFDLIYIDPPYAEASHCLEAVALIDKSHLLNKDGVMFVEQPAKAEFQPILTHLIIRRCRHKGMTALYELVNNCATLL